MLQAYAQLQSIVVMDTCIFPNPAFACGQKQATILYNGTATVEYVQHSIMLKSILVEKGVYLQVFQSIVYYVLSVLHKHPLFFDLFCPSAVIKYLSMGVVPYSYINQSSIDIRMHTPLTFKHIIYPQIMLHKLTTPIHTNVISKYRISPRFIACQYT